MVFSRTSCSHGAGWPPRSADRDGRRERSRPRFEIPGTSGQVQELQRLSMESEMLKEAPTIAGGQKTGRRRALKHQMVPRRLRDRRDNKEKARVALALDCCDRARQSPLSPPPKASKARTCRPHHRRRDPLRPHRHAATALRMAHRKGSCFIAKDTKILARRHRQAQNLQARLCLGQPDPGRRNRHRGPPFWFRSRTQASAAQGFMISITERVR